MACLSRDVSLQLRSRLSTDRDVGPSLPPTSSIFLFYEEALSFQGQTAASIEAVVSRKVFPSSGWFVLNREGLLLLNMSSYR